MPIWSRNIGIISLKQMEFLSTKRIAILGCGLGSLVAESAVRFGFRHLLIADGDTVEETNLNRTVYRNRDIGRPKAEALAAHLMSICPDIDVTMHNHYIRHEEVSAIVSSCDLVIDTIDLSAIDIIVAAHREARKQGKSSLFPLNMGYGSGLMVFDPSSATLEECLGFSIDTETETFANLYANKEIFQSWLQMIVPHLNTYQLQLLESFLGQIEENGWCPLPQSGIAGQISAVMCVTAAIRVLLGLPVIMAPSMMTVDLWDIMSHE